MACSYPSKYVDQHGFIKSIESVDNILIQEIKAIDARVEDLSKKISTGGNCQCDPEVINELTSRVGLLEDETTQLFETIGADEGENDTNLDDIQSKLATHSSCIKGLQLATSENKTSLNSVTAKLDNKLDKTFNTAQSIDWFASDGKTSLEHFSYNTVLDLLFKMRDFIQDLTQWCELLMQKYNELNQLYNEMNAKYNNIVAEMSVKLDDVHYRTANYNNGIILNTVDGVVVAVSPLHTALATNASLMKWGFTTYDTSLTNAENMSWNTHASTKEEMDELYNKIGAKYTNMDSTQNQIDQLDTRVTTLEEKA